LLIDHLASADRPRHRSRRANAQRLRLGV